MALSEYDPKKVALFVSSLFLIAAAVVAVFVKLKAAPETSGITNAEAQMLVEKVSKLIAIPSDEEPTIATVTELAPLADKPFFAHAKVGDRVLIFVKNRLAILYDPENNKILEVGPLNLSTDATNSAQPSNFHTNTTNSALPSQTQSEQLQFEPAYVTVPF